MDGLVSAGGLTEVLQPVLFAVAALVSAIVLADALRGGFNIYEVAGWTLATFFYPYIIFPLYIIARFIKRREPRPRRKFTQTILRVFVPAFVYLLIILSIGAVLREREAHSFEHYLERAIAARLRDRHLEAADAYRAALAVQDDPHTHKLLGVQLMMSHKWADAYEHFLAAEKGGENDEALSFYLASVLDELKRGDEAVGYYLKFTTTSLCKRAVPDQRCQSAQARVPK